MYTHMHGPRLTIRIMVDEVICEVNRLLLNSNIIVMYVPSKTHASYIVPSQNLLAF